LWCSCSIKFVGCKQGKHAVEHLHNADCFLLYNDDNNNAQLYLIWTIFWGSWVLGHGFFVVVQDESSIYHLHLRIVPELLHYAVADLAGS
jgi:hypothetical protein